MMQIGDVVQRIPASFADGGNHECKVELTGTVVYIHPLKRFHVVKFEKGQRESFFGVAK